MEKGQYYMVLKGFEASGINCSVGRVILCREVVGSGNFNLLATSNKPITRFVSTGLSTGRCGENLRKLYKNEIKHIKEGKYGK